MSAPTTPTASGIIKNGILVVTVLTDELREHDAADSLRDQVTALVEQASSRDLVLNLEKLQFVSSIGLVFFINVRKYLTTGRIVLCNLSSNVRQVFEYCRLIATENCNAAPFEEEVTPDDAIRRLLA